MAILLAGALLLSTLSSDAAPELVDGGSDIVESDAAPEPAPLAEPAYGVWDRLAQCESGGNWHSASNPLYKGGLQFDPPTWAAYGGLEYATRADFATRAQQIAIAERLHSARGFAPWPACSRLLRLR